MIVHLHVCDPIIIMTCSTILIKIRVDCDHNNYNEIEVRVFAEVAMDTIYTKPV